MNDKEYREIWNEVSEHFQKTHISKDQVDKLLDMVSNDKKIFTYIINHFKKNLDIDTYRIKDTKEKKKNLDKILKLIELEIMNNE